MSVTPRLPMLVARLPVWLHYGAARASIDPAAGATRFQWLAPAAAVSDWLHLHHWISEAVRNLWHRLTDRRSQ